MTTKSEDMRQDTLYREVLEAANAAIWVTDAEDRIILALPSVEPLVARSAEELLNVDVTAETAPPLMRQIRPFYESSRETMSPVVFGASITTSDNRTIERSIRLIPRRHGTVFSGMICAVQGAEPDLPAAEATPEAKIHRALSSPEEAVIVVDPTGLITHLNPRAERWTGWEESRIVGRPIDEVVRVIHEGPDSRNPVIIALQTGADVEISNHPLLVTRDERRIPISGRACLIRDLEKHVISAILRFHDEAENRLERQLIQTRLELIEYASHHAEDELLSRSLDEVGAFVDSPIGFYHTVDADQKTLTLQQWSTRTLQEFCHTETKGVQCDIDEAGVWVDCVRQKRPVIHNDYLSLPHKKGMPPGHASVVRELVVPVLRNERVVAILGVGNKPTDYTSEDVETVSYLADVIWEIVRNKRAEESLRESEVRFRSIFNQTFQLAGVLSLGGTLMAANQTALDFIEADRADVIGRPFWETPWWTHSQESQDWIRDAVKRASNGEIVRSEVTHISPDGSPHVFDFSLKPILDAQGRVLHLMPESRDITDVKTAEDELKSLTTRLSMAVKAADLGVWEYDIGRRQVYFDAKMLQLYGLSEAEFDGSVRGWIKQIHPEDRKTVWKTAQQVGVDRGGMETEFRIVRPNGEIRHMKAYALPVRDPHGDTTGAIGVNYDITEQKTAEESLRQRETLLQKVFDILPVGLWFADRDGRLLRGNEAGIRIWGAEPLVAPSEYGAFHARRLPSREEIGPDDWALVRTIRDGVTVTDELLEIDAFDGQTKTILNYTAPVLDDREQIEGAVVVNLDITERERTAAEARRLAAAVEQAAEVVVITDTEGLIQYANPAFTRVTGYALDEIIGENPRILQSGRHDEAFYRDLWDSLTIHGMWHGRFTNRRKNGELYTEDAAISAVRDTSGAVISYVGVKRDITAELNLEQQLRQAQKLESIGTLASGVAHEINNPLMGILNYAELAKDKVADDKVIGYLDGVIHEGNRVAEIVKSLLSFARQEKTGRSPARISDIIEASLSLLRASLRKHQIQLELDIAEDLPSITCRSQQIQQVLVNLITNAQSALNERFPEFDDDKVLVVRAQEHRESNENWIRITVEDHGIGIPEEIHDRVFDPFFTKRPRHQGTGLGLSVSHGIVKDHHGRISFESREGESTRFYVDLPLSNARESRTV